jgi:putative flippase GtrA
MTSNGFDHDDLARTVISVQNFNLKIILGRIIGIALALGILYVLIPGLIESNVLLALGLIVVLPFVGLFVGERAMLMWLRG